MWQRLSAHQTGARRACAVAVWYRCLPYEYLGMEVQYRPLRHQPTAVRPIVPDRFDALWVLSSVLPVEGPMVLELDDIYRRNRCFANQRQRGEPARGNSSTIAHPLSHDMLQHSIQPEGGDSYLRARIRLFLLFSWGWAWVGSYRARVGTSPRGGLARMTRTFPRHPSFRDAMLTSQAFPRHATSVQTQ